MGTSNGRHLTVTRVFVFALVSFGILTLLTMLFTPSITARFYPLPEDQGPAWYYWQLVDSGVLTRITYWAGYAIHQLVVFALVIAAMRSERSTVGEVSRLNVMMLEINLLFVVLHLIQTYFWYDGLAQDVPIWTSQGSVIVMLVLILYMMIPVRGLFWGRRFAPPQKVLRFIRRWHGLYISWALVYTFWFHPMDGNWGLISGFIYMFLLFIQLSLFHTRLHLNKTWIVLLEAMVVIHGTLITVYKHNPIWPMFLFGFLVMFVFTQVHTWQPPKWVRFLVLAIFIVGVAGVYGFIRGFGHLYELTFIPVALYGGAVALLGVGWILEWIGTDMRRI